MPPTPAEEIIRLRLLLRTKAHPLLSAAHTDTQAYKVSLVAEAAMNGFALIWTCIRFYQYIEGECLNSIHCWIVYFLCLAEVVTSGLSIKLILWYEHIMKKQAERYLSRGSDMIYVWAKAVIVPSLLRFTVNLAARREGRY